MKVPLGNISLGKPELDGLAAMILRNRVSYGPLTRKLESLFAELHRVKHCVFMASGTCALQVAIEAAKEQFGWGDGDEVIVPATTFIATMSTVRQAGLVPVLADVYADTFNLSPKAAWDRCTERTVAILPVHLLGRAACMDELRGVAETFGLQVIEDCCEAVGVKCNGRPVGSFGIAGAISTYVCHHVSTGVGGAVLTNDIELADISRSLMAHGRDTAYLSIDDDDGLTDAELGDMMARRYSFVRWGHSYRATEMEAALGVAQFDGLEHDQRHRIDVAAALNRHLSPFSDRLELPEFSEGSVPLFYPIVVRNGTCEPLSRHLESNGIETRPIMPLLTQPPVIKCLARRGERPEDFPIAHSLCSRGFLIGCHAGMDESHCDFIAEKVGEHYAR